MRDESEDRRRSWRLTVELKGYEIGKVGDQGADGMIDVASSYPVDVDPRVRLDLEILDIPSELVASSPSFLRNLDESESLSRGLDPDRRRKKG